MTPLKWEIFLGSGLPLRIGSGKFLHAVINPLFNDCSSIFIWTLELSMKAKPNTEVLVYGTGHELNRFDDFNLKFLATVTPVNYGQPWLVWHIFEKVFTG